MAYAQWRTANQKVVADLFDRRIKVFDALREATVETVTAFTRAQANAEFLFGKDVNDYRKGKALNIYGLAAYHKINERAPNFAEMVERKSEIFPQITDFYKTAPQVFAPYIFLTQKKTPWRPW